MQFTFALGIAKCVPQTDCRLNAMFGITLFFVSIVFIDHNVCSTTFMQRFLMKPEYFRHRDNYGLQTTDSNFTHSQFINIPLWIAEVEHRTYTELFFVLFC